MRARSRRRFGILFAVSSGFGAWAHPSTARAEDPALSACIAANESSIARRSEHRLLEARAEALKCATEACPALLRDACKRRVDQVNAALPSIVFEVKDETGADVAAKVTMDGQRLAEGPQGTAITSDPGSHRFVFEASGRLAVERTFILREGEANRRERIALAPASPPALGALPVTGAPEPRTASPLASAPSSEHAASSLFPRQRMYALVAAGVGVVGVAVGVGFGATVQSRSNRSQAECPSASDCPQHEQAVSDHDAAATSAAVATIATIAGGAALAAGVVLWFTAPRGVSTGGALSRAVGLLPFAGPGSAGLLVRADF
jgi:hypothetical protein